MPKYSSQQQMEKEGANFKPLKAGAYIVRLNNIEVKDKKNYDGNIVPMVTTQLEVYENAGRKPEITLVDGSTAKPLARKLFFDIEKLSMGFRENFTIPSKLRALVAVLTGVNPFDEMDDGPDQLTHESVMEFLKEYEGEYLVVNLLYSEKNGKGKNKIADFQPVPDDFEADEVVEAQAEQRAKEAAKKDKGGTKPSRGRTKPAEDDDDDDDTVPLDVQTEKDPEDDDDVNEDLRPKKKTPKKKKLF